MSYLPVEQFKRMARAKVAPPAGTLIRKRLVSVVQPLEDRKVRFTASTAAVDRSGDVIKQDGWVLDAFLSNPVCLWAHRSEDPPIGRWVQVGVEEGVLQAVVEFVPAEMPVVGDLAEMCLRMNRTGFLNAVSVGFIPLEWDVANSRDDGESWFPPLDYVRQELIEISLCSIPCNPEALIDPAERDTGLVNDGNLETDAVDVTVTDAVGRRIARRNLRRSLYG